LLVENPTKDACSSSNPTYAMADWELALITASSSNQSSLSEIKLASSIFFFEKASLILLMTNLKEWKIINLKSLKQENASICFYKEDFFFLF
jgi:hypothetical protein